MQILYVISMIVIFMLCIVLFSTARRILHSTSHPGGELSLTQLKSAIEPYESDVQLNPVDMAMFPPEPEYIEPPPIPEGSNLSAVMAEEEEIQEAVLTPEPTPAQAPKSVQSVEIADNREIAPPTQSTRRARMATSLPSGYNYFLECLLLGVSIVVLVQTQRNTSRYRSVPSSDQVA